MQVLTAKTKSCPRTVKTKFGEKSVIDIVVEGKDTAIWRAANDPALMSLKSGQDVTVVKDANGKINLIESATTATGILAVNETATTGLDLQTKREIADYVGQMGSLYGFCYQTAQNKLPDAPNEAKQAMASSLFIATQRKFGLS